MIGLWRPVVPSGDGNDDNAGVARPPLLAHGLLYVLFCFPCVLWSRKKKSLEKGKPKTRRGDGNGLCVAAAALPAVVAGPIVKRFF